MPELLEETAISLPTVRKFIRQVKAGQQLLILDACRNEPTTLGRDAGSARLDETMAREIYTLVAPSADRAQTTHARRGPRSARVGWARFLTSIRRAVRVGSATTCWSLSGSIRPTRSMSPI